MNESFILRFKEADVKCSSLHQQSTLESACVYTLGEKDREREKERERERVPVYCILYFWGVRKVQKIWIQDQNIGLIYFMPMHDH